MHREPSPWEPFSLEQLFALKKLIKGCIENNLPMKINCIYFHAEFDSARHEYIKASVKPLWFPCQIHQDLPNILRKHLDQTLTDWFEVASDTGQGAIQTPPLFNIILNWVLEQAMTEKTTPQGLTLQCRLSSPCPEKHITDTNDADNLGVLNDSKNGLQESTDKILTLPVPILVEEKKN